MKHNYNDTEAEQVFKCFSVVMFLLKQPANNQLGRSILTQLQGDVITRCRSEVPHINVNVAASAFIWHGHNMD